MKTHNTMIKEEHIIRYLEKNLKDSPEKTFVIDKVKDSFEHFSCDRDFEEWVKLPEDSYVVCDKCKKEVQHYWHKHVAYIEVGVKPRLRPLNFTETYLCSNCYDEIAHSMYERWRIS